MKNYFYYSKKSHRDKNGIKRGLGNSRVDHIQVDSVVINCSLQETLSKHVRHPCVSKHDRSHDHQSSTTSKPAAMNSQETNSTITATDQR